MTPSERKKVCYRAMELVATGKEIFSCSAILATRVFYSRYIVKTAYAEFYDMPRFGFWPALGYDFSPPERQRALNHRLMLLAWFAEVGPKGIGL